MDPEVGSKSVPCSVADMCLLWNRVQVEKMLEWAKARPELARFGTLFLFAYAFLLRLPSEALPAVKGLQGGQASCYRDGETVVLELQRR